MVILYALAKRLLQCLPGERRYAAARAIGRWALPSNPARKRIILDNLEPLVGRERAAAIAPDLLGNFLTTFVDFVCPPEPLPPAMTDENAAFLTNAYARTKRVICVTAHIGHWELGMTYLAEKGYAASGLYATYTSPGIVRWLNAHRDPRVSYHPTTSGAAESCIQAVGQGRVVGLVGDLPFGERGRRVTIAGRPARLPIGPWVIAVRARATVLPAFIIRQSPGHYKVTFHDPIDPPGGPLRRQVETMQDQFVKHLETYLRKYPEQWGVLQPFWES